MYGLDKRTGADILDIPDSIEGRTWIFSILFLAVTKIFVWVDCLVPRTSVFLVGGFCWWIFYTLHEWPNISSKQIHGEIHPAQWCLIFNSKQLCRWCTMVDTPPGKLTWNLKITRFKKKSHVTNLHFWVPSVSLWFRGRTWPDLELSSI